MPDLLQQGYYTHPLIYALVYDLITRLSPVPRHVEMELPVEKVMLATEAVYKTPAQNGGIRGSILTDVGDRCPLLGGDVIIASNRDPNESFQNLAVYLQTEAAVGKTV